MTFEELKDIAARTLNPRDLTGDASAGEVAAALESESGRVYTGVCIDTPCGMGFCAEHAAAAAMVTAGENRVVRMAAVCGKSPENAFVVAPCGRCREFIRQLHERNGECQVLLPNGVKTISELLPDAW